MSLNNGGNLLEHDRIGRFYGIYQGSDDDENPQEKYKSYGHQNRTATAMSHIVRAMTIHRQRDEGSSTRGKKIPIDLSDELAHPVMGYLYRS